MVSLFIYLDVVFHLLDSVILLSCLVSTTSQTANHPISGMGNGNFNLFSSIFECGVFASEFFVALLILDCRII